MTPRPSALLRCIAALMTSAATLTPAHAQDAAPPDSTIADDADAAKGARVFTLADLAQYAPQTALDMVRRIPGFTLDGGSQGRGLGQASQNVLVNGARISGKSNDAVSVLARIDAKQVIRIEIVDGANLDVPGLTGEVANVVYAASQISGTWRYSAQLRERIDDNFLDGALNLSGGGTDSRWSLSLANNRSRQGNFGPETVSDADGDILLVRDEVQRFDNDRPRIAGSYSETFANGDELSLNGAGGLNIARQRGEGAILLADGTRFDEVASGGEDEWEVELGGDYSFGFAGGRTKLIALQRLEHSPTFDEFGIVGGSRSRFERTIDEGETIARLEHGWAAGGSDWAVSLEGAYNRLTAQSLLIVVPVAGPETRTELPDNAINELRGEAIASLSRPLGPTLSLQINAGAEASRIAADDNDAQRYFNPKGSASLSWRARDDLTLDASVERSVDQLNFFDFLATVDVQDGFDRGQNNRISPPTRWIARLEAVKRLGPWGTVTPTLAIERIEGVIEYIPIDAVTEALGNAGAATVWQAGAEGTLLLDPLGVAGARFDFDVTIGDSRFIDPLLGTPRALNGQTYARIDLSFRHDIPGSQIAYGGAFFDQDEDGRFRLDQFSNRFNGGPRLSAFVEHKNVWRGIQANLGVQNILGSTDRFERIAYVDRRDGPIAFTESRERAFGRIVSFSLTGSL